MGCRWNIVLSLMQAQVSLGVAQGVLGLRGCFLPMPSDTHLLCGVDTALAPWALRLLCTPERNSVPLGGFFTAQIVKERGE